jgi:hypothetical protein
MVRSKRHEKRGLQRAALLALLLLLPMLLVSLEAHARAGGGGGGGGSSSSSSVRSTNSNLFVNLMTLAGLSFAALHLASVNRRINNRRRQVAEALVRMSQLEPEWSEQALERQVHERFLLLQDAWSRQEIGLLRLHLDDGIYEVWQEEIKIQKQSNIRNHIQDVEIKSIRLVAVRNYINDQKDEFTACIDAQCREGMVPDNPGFMIEEKQTAVHQFREFWTFIRDKDKWKLKEVRQFSGWSRLINSQIIHEYKSGIVRERRDTPAVRLSAEKKRSAAKSVTLKSSSAIILSSAAVIVLIDAFAFIHPIGALKKILILCVPLSYTAFVYLQDRVLRALDEADAEQRVALLALTSTLLTIFTTLVAGAILFNALADRTQPLSITTKVIKTTQHRSNKSTYYGLVLNAADFPPCCRTGNNTFVIRTSGHQLREVEAGRSEVIVKIKTGILGMPYLKDWQLRPKPTSVSMEKEKESGHTDVQATWSKPALEALHWKAEALSDEAPTDVQIARWPNGALKSKEPIVNGKVYGIAEFRFANGQLYGLIPFKNGEKHGRFILYKENGTPDQELSYKDGQPHGMCRWFNEDGTVKQQALYVEGQHVEPR